jgi:hypothetical protein
MAANQIRPRPANFNSQPLTRDDALRIADAQIAQWKRDGIGPAEALLALHNEQPARWRQVREQMAEWAVLYWDCWED